MTDRLATYQQYAAAAVSGLAGLLDPCARVRDMKQLAAIADGFAREMCELHDRADRDFAEAAQMEQRRAAYLAERAQAEAAAERLPLVRGRLNAAPWKPVTDSYNNFQCWERALADGRERDRVWLESRTIYLHGRETLTCAAAWPEGNGASPPGWTDSKAGAELLKAAAEEAKRLAAEKSTNERSATQAFRARLNVADWVESGAGYMREIVYQTNPVKMIHDFAHRRSARSGVGEGRVWLWDTPIQYVPIHTWPDGFGPPPPNWIDF